MSSFELSGATEWGGRPVARTVASAGHRQRVVLSGTIHAAQAITSARGPAYRCTLDDGTGELDLLFLGRKLVPGLSVDASCSVEGTARTEGDRLVVWNPLYRLDAPYPPGREVPERVELAPAQGASPRVVRRVPEAPTSHAGNGAVSVEAAGHFRIYLGAAAGVGKTVAMLDEAHRRLRRGTDVVIGFVETHNRPVTAAHTQGLEVVPRRRVDYRGAVLEEMDLEALLKRHPRVALVDELAHTNVPGSGSYEKRWQDVLELLEAGIDVITTVNIQHLESIADAVERIAGVAVRERVPDRVVRRADQIELVDSSPEQLRRRMVHGNIYPPEKVPQALANFFRVDNLNALRELALRFLADETEEELLEHLQRQQTKAAWETTERMVVGVTAAPGTDDIVRRAARMASRMKADLHVVHVSTGDSEVKGPAEDRLGLLRRVVGDVGAAWHEILASDPVDALIDFARRQHVTQLVIGSSRRSRWEELKGGSVVKRISRRAADAEIDVHIIARRESPLSQASGGAPSAEATGDR